MVLKKGFPGASRSSVRKDLGLVLKKARANNKENKKARCKNGQEHSTSCQILTRKPVWKFPCDVCAKPVRLNENGIVCNDMIKGFI